MISENNFSSFHMLEEDEVNFSFLLQKVWHFYDGNEVVINILNPKDSSYKKIILGKSENSVLTTGRFLLLYSKVNLLLKDSPKKVV